MCGFLEINSLNKGRFYPPTPPPPPLCYSKRVAEECRKQIQLAVRVGLKLRDSGLQVQL